MPEQEAVNVRIVTCARMRAHADAVEEPLRAEEPLHREKPVHGGEPLNPGKPLDTEASLHANDEELLHANDVE